MTRVILWAFIAAAAISVLLLSAFAAFAHDEHWWVAKYKNAHGISCCGPNDTTFVDAKTARSARIGTVIIADFPGLSQLPVMVEIIYQTEDPQGLAVLSKYGCLFSGALF
jgi:hypothetical protein